MCMGTEGMEGDKFNSNDFSSRISDNDSLLRRRLCVKWGSWGEKKERERGTMGRRKREERLPPFPFSHRPPRASFFFFFDYWNFYRDTQREPLRRRE